ncbi:MAG: coproporphyrinogen III oxidase [Alphaproteobacteria bacterium]|nr:coproporphyrinogen III oxidase [Alphaproteobacteria bacterium]
MSAHGKDPGFGLYVHWPFCLAKCPYCDFNSHVRHQSVNQAAYVAAFNREMAWFAERSKSQTITSIFFGGGTPSLMTPHTVGALLDAAAGHWTIATDAEITLEANPTSVEARNFAALRSAGVNRVSVGVQSLNDDALKFLGRQHTAHEALAAFQLAAKTFDRVSFDMIYARPKQSAEAWRAELGEALSHAEGHMSLYQLTIEPKTRFADLHAAGKLVVPGESLALALYDVTQELTEAAGLPAYEVSNHAAPGHECRHNVLYWRYGDYAGVGPGAHSRLTLETGERIGSSTLKSPEAWLQQVGARGDGIEDTESLSGEDRADEYLLMGLRLNEGISLKRHRELGGAALAQARVEALEAEGLVELDVEAERLVATPAGRRVLNAVIGYLAAG